MNFEELINERNRIKSHVDDLEHKLYLKKKELNDVETALKVMKKYIEPELNLDFGYLKDKPSKTIMECIVDILENKDGLKSQELLKELRKIYDPQLMRTSMSPQLSRLKEKKIIDNRNNRWWLNRGKGYDQ